MKISRMVLICLSVIITLLPYTALAADPTVKTLKYVYQTTSATANGLVNPNGTSCQVSFQYGTTTGYGSSTGPVTVSGSSNTPVSIPLAGLASSVDGVPYHYRTVALCNGTTYYGSDIAFGSIDYNVLPNLNIVRSCAEIDVMANFDIVNKNPMIIQISYASGESFSGVLDLEPNVSYQIFIYSYSMITFSYKNVIVAQMPTNNQPCVSPPNPPGTQLALYGLGYGYSGVNNQVLSIKNDNGFSVSADIAGGLSGGTYTIPALGSTTYTDFNTGMTSFGIFYNGELSYGVAATGLRWPGAFTVTATSLTSTATSSDFLLQNNDDLEHTAVLRNAGGTEHRYTLPAYGSQQVTVEYGPWDLYLAVPDMVGPALVGDHIQVDSLSPADICQRTLTVTMTGTGTGLINATGCTLTWVGNTGRCCVADGTSITLSGAPDTSSFFAGWSDGTGPASICSGTGNCAFTVGAVDVTLYAQWSINSYAVTGNAVSSGGTISCSPSSVSYGGGFSCSICPVRGYDLKQLSDNSITKTFSIDGNCYSYAVTGVAEAHTVEATYQNFPVIILRGVSSDTFSAIQPATNSATQSNDRIQIQAGPFTEDVDFDHNGISASLEGGFDPGFSGTVGETIIHGQLMITNGTLTVDGITME